MDALLRGAAWVAREGLATKPGEQVLVVTDLERSPRVAEALQGALQAAGAEAVVVTMATRQAGQPLPASVAAAIERADVLLAATTRSMTYTDAVMQARSRGARVITMPLIAEEALARTADVDAAEIRELTRRVAERMASARELRLTSPGGTDLRVTLGGHPADVLDGQCREPGEYDQIPAGVASVLAAQTEGVLVADLAVSFVGSVREPVRLEIRESRIVAIHGGDEARTLERVLAAADDANVYHCAAEIGVGTNRWARYAPSTDFATEGARMSGWVHVGFGDDHTLPGGQVRAVLHGDALLRDCTLEADGEPIAAEGRLVLDRTRA